MRITGGQARRRILASFKGLDIRPTSDQVREALFSILGQDLEGKRILDLFAGTGSLGLEALSRGAERAVFIESSSRAVALIRKNIEICGFKRQSLVLKRDLRRGLPALETMGGLPFDLVFIDPPYRKQLIPMVMAALAKKQVLSPAAQVVAETGREEVLGKTLATLDLTDTRTYGDTKIHFFIRRVEQ